MQIAETGFIPQAWEQAQIIMIPKLGKADYTAASAYRLIALLLTLSNIYKKLLTKHLSEPVKQKHMLHGGHYGGGPNKSGHDALKHLVSWIQNEWTKGNIVCALFADANWPSPQYTT